MLHGVPLPEWNDRIQMENMMDRLNDGLSRRVVVWFVHSWFGVVLWLWWELTAAWYIRIRCPVMTSLGSLVYTCTSFAVALVS